MFDQLFKRPDTVRRHSNAPYAEERRQYLAACARQGNTKSTMLFTARDLLWVARKLSVYRNLSTVKMEQVRASGLRLETYVVLKGGPCHSGGGFNSVHHISAGNTYPRTCFVKHVLGLTHISGKSQKGKFVLKRKTIIKRMRSKLQAIKQELRRRMRDPVKQTGEWLQMVVQGYFNYHAIPGNLQRLHVFRERVTRLWRRTLRRRGQKHRPDWARIRRLIDNWLPSPRVLHPYPNVRFAAHHPR